MVWGRTDTGALKAIHKDESWGNRLYRSSPTDWLELSVEIQAHGIKGSWKYQYRFRLKGRDEFEIVEVKD